MRGFPSAPASALVALAAGNAKADPSIRLSGARLAGRSIACAANGPCLPWAENPNRGVSSAPSRSWSVAPPKQKSRGSKASS